MMIFKKKICVFDFDGTLVDSMHGFADVAGKVINKHYKVPYDVAKSKYYETSGLPFFQQLEVLFPKNPQNSVLAAEFEAKKLDNFFRDEYFNDVEETIGYLNSKKIKVVVSSNNFQENIDKYVGAQKIKFDYILGFKQDFCKGFPHFEYVLKNEKVSLDDIVFIGDSIQDAKRAFLCNVDFIGKTGTFKREDFQKAYPNILIIDRISQLKEIL